MQGGHLASLTSLRFFAAAVVVAYHAGMWSQPALGAPSGLFRFGFVGVSFFYVLSGFVLTWTWRPGERARFFYLRRFARVWPLHALTTAFAVLLGLAGVQIGMRWSALPAHLGLVHAWSWNPATAFAWNGLSWSLSDEAFFYAIFPALVAAVAARRRGPLAAAAAGVAWLVLAGAALLALAPERTPALYWLPAYRVGEFAVGVALGVVIRRGWRTTLPWWGGVGGAGAAYVALWAVNRATGGFFEEQLWAAHLVTLPGFVAAVAACASSDLAGRRSLLGSRPLVKLGQWSFALYLVHGLALRVVHPVAVEHPWAAWAAALASVALAAAAYEWFERPAERRIRAWGHQRESLVSRA